LLLAAVEDVHRQLVLAGQLPGDLAGEAVAVRPDVGDGAGQPRAGLGGERGGGGPGGGRPCRRADARQAGAGRGGGPRGAGGRRTRRPAGWPPARRRPARPPAPAVTGTSAWSRSSLADSIVLTIWEAAV